MIFFASLDMGLKHERVRQIRKKALRKMRKAYNRKSLCSILSDDAQ
jgi:DNA-directed RNA polymerase sigma subunit (sigma70/sigma32)